MLKKYIDMFKIGTTITTQWKIPKNRVKKLLWIKEKFLLREEQKLSIRKKHPRESKKLL